MVGDKAFTEKYAGMLSKCTGKVVKPHIDRSKNIWFVKANSFQLFTLFKKVRVDTEYLELLLHQSGRQSSLLFIEGFFDAEGCVKIIKEPVRITPKICLDLTNTNKVYLEIIRSLLQEILGIEARYSIQKAFMGKDGFPRQQVYHLRIYKRASIRKFLENIETTKVKLPGLTSGASPL